MTLISQMLRPFDQVRFPEHCGLAPIAGLQMDVGGVHVHDAMLVRCNRAEWEVMEKAYIFKDWHAEYYAANPVFLLHEYDGPIDAERIAPAMDRLARDGRRVVTACRLYKMGQVLEPTYTARFLVSGAMRYRDVGPFRSEYLAMPVDSLVWQLAENEVEDLSLISANLALLSGAPGMESFDALLDAFNLSFAPTIKTPFKLLLRFTVHEMLFENLSDAVQAGSSSYDRALTITRLMAPAIVDARCEHFFERQVREVRNTIVHHSPETQDVDFTYAAAMLQIVAMAAIRLLMRFYRLQTAPEFAAARRALGWRKLPAKEMLNSCLARASNGDVGPYEQVMSLQA